jgi:hypothetical protein
MLHVCPVSVTVCDVSMIYISPSLAISGYVIADGRPQSRKNYIDQSLRLDSECGITAHVTCRLVSGVRRQFFLSLSHLRLQGRIPRFDSRRHCPESQRHCMRNSDENQMNSECGITAPVACHLGPATYPPFFLSLLHLRPQAEYLDPIRRPSLDRACCDLTPHRSLGRGSKTGSRSGHNQLTAFRGDGEAEKFPLRRIAPAPLMKPEQCPGGG